jgi:hypothetical protein
MAVSPATAPVVKLMVNPRVGQAAPWLEFRVISGLIPYFLKALRIAVLVAKDALVRKLSSA